MNSVSAVTQIWVGWRSEAGERLPEEPGFWPWLRDRNHLLLQALTVRCSGSKTPQWTNIQLLRIPDGGLGGGYLTIESLVAKPWLIAHVGPLPVRRSVMEWARWQVVYSHAASWWQRLALPRIMHWSSDWFSFSRQLEPICVTLLYKRQLSLKWFYLSLFVYSIYFIYNNKLYMQ